MLRPTNFLQLTTGMQNNDLNVQKLQIAKNDDKNGRKFNGNIIFT